MFTKKIDILICSLFRSNARRARNITAIRAKMARECLRVTVAEEKLLLKRNIETFR